MSDKCKNSESAAIKCGVVHFQITKYCDRSTMRSKKPRAPTVDPIYLSVIAWMVTPDLVMKALFVTLLLAHVTCTLCVVLQGRLVSTTRSFYDSDQPIEVLLHLPAAVVGLGVCVDVQPIRAQIEARSFTACTRDRSSVHFAIHIPGVYYVKARMQNSDCGVELFNQRAKVVTVLAGNLSMAIAINGVMSSLVILLAPVIFLWVPLFLLPLPMTPS